MAQFTSMQSTDTEKYMEVYNDLCTNFENVFAWISLKLREHLKDVYDEIRVYADVLSFTPVHPFSGFVVNFNVVTMAHWDAQDLTACAIIVLGAHEGNELCLHKPGLVFSLQEGDLIVFFSGRITHFNLHFKGLRASLVLHSNRVGKEWAENQMGWAKNGHLLVW